MNDRTKQYLVVGLLVAAGVAVVTGAASGLSSWVADLFGSVTGKKGSSSSTVPVPTPDQVALVIGALLDPAPGGSASVAAVGNTYPVLVEVRSLGGPASGNVRLRVTEKPLFDPAQTFDFTWPAVKVPAAGDAVQLTGDMPAMSLVDAPLSALFGRGAKATLYFNDSVIGASAFTVGASFT